MKALYRLLTIHAVRNERCDYETYTGVFVNGRMASRISGLVGTILLLGSTNFAYADCSDPLTNFDAGVCDAQTFSPADADLNRTYSDLYNSVPQASQWALRQDELAWMRLRDNQCVLQREESTSVDFACATKLTKARIEVLKSKLPTQPVSDWLFKVLGTAMPWIWQIDGPNINYRFSRQDGTSPTIVSLATLGATAGQTIVIKYVSGEMSVGSAWQASDANGSPQEQANDINGVTGQPFPSRYMSPYPINIGALVGAFTDNNGVVVGTPFAIGDGPAQEVIPQGTAQLQLGVNDDLYSDNTGSFSVTVSVH